MKKFTALLGMAAFGLTALSANALDRPDVYVVKFRDNNCKSCVMMERNLDNAMAMVGSSKAKIVKIDTSDSLHWEVSANRAFDANIVPQYNKWAGLTGFVAVIDRESRRTLGCFKASDDSYKMANFIKSTLHLPYDRAVANRPGQFQCPPAHNVDPEQ